MADTLKDEQRWSQLMGNAQQGDEQSYAQLLEELGRVIAAFLRSRFGPIDLIEDCTQECLIAIHSARHTYDTKRLFRPWFFAIVRNRTIDMLRSQKSYKTALEKNRLGHIEGTSSPVEDEVNKSMVFSMLAPAYRDVLLLTKVAGFTTAEAAEKLGLSESAVRVRVHRGIKETRKILQNEQIEK
ncbi:sigma-70 family RNA polymerase sigma factor [Methyloprofundus sp.]|uniref:sigma-70 family RNA polymerase sigma factor n=1 Tax=Methyloprofundus sp. TaxID=2020875 RepID=UPI003D10AE09